jgi:hypothetical protein
MPSAVADHPFRAAWATRDLDAWIEALSPDIVLRSPVVRGPFRGRSAAAEPSSTRKLDPGGES